MNELFFGIKDLSWRAKRPSAYYFDDLCELLVQDKNYDDREDLLQGFVVPLYELLRKKYELIKDQKPASDNELFILEIPKEISRAAKPFMKWYIDKYPEGDYIETAVDFISALGESDKTKGMVTIFGE